MITRLTDKEIVELVQEPKHLPTGFRDTLLNKMKMEDVHKRSELKVTGSESNVFMIKVRQNKLNPLNFSVILAYAMPETTGLFLLRRYNGKSHEHTNNIEGNRFRDFHIHYATERYQARGFNEEAYAEVTNNYSDLGGALHYMITDCNFILPPDEPALLL